MGTDGTAIAMPDAPLTDALVALIVGVLSVWDAVLSGLVALGTGDPLTALGMGNVQALAEIVVALVGGLSNMVEAALIAFNI